MSCPRPRSRRSRALHVAHRPDQIATDQSTLAFWLILGGVSILMLGVTRLALYSLKPGRRPALRIILAHLIAVALIGAIGGFDMPYLGGWTRWGYAIALCGFGTLPWMAMDFIRLRLRHGATGASPPPTKEEQR